MKHTFLFITLFTATVCIGQSGGGLAAHVPSYNTGLISSKERFGSIYNNGMVGYDDILQEYGSIEGSPFLHGGEIIVDLVFYTDSIIKDLPIRYDLYNNEIIAKKEDGSTVVLDQRYYRGFTHNNGGAIETYSRLTPTDFTFYHVLFRTGDFVFYKSYKTRIEKVNHYVPGTDIKPQKFLQSTEYFVLQNDIAHPVNLRNGEALEYFPKDYAAQVPELKEKLRIKKLRKEEDYVRIINAFVVPD